MTRQHAYPLEDDDLPQWGAGRWVLTIIAVSAFLFLAWVGIVTYLVVFG